MSKSLEIIGRYVGARFRFDNPDDTQVIIGSVRVAPAFADVVKDAGVDPFNLTIKGEADPKELQEGGTYRFFGVWSSYQNRRSGQREQQFAFRTFVPHIPHDADGLVDYLSNAGRGNGIGPSKARRLVQELGVDEVLVVCRTQPGKVAKIAAVDQCQAERFAEKLQGQAATENATLEVDKLLHSRGFPKSLTRRVIKAWGNRAAELINEDPFALMQFRGVGYRLCDKLWIELGKDPKAIDRQALAAWYSMAANNDGHTWFDAAFVNRELTRMIGPGANFREAIIRGKDYGKRPDDHYGAIATIRTEQKDGPLVENGATLWLAEGKNAEAERYVAEAIAAATHETSRFDVTRYEDHETIVKRVLDHATCARCHRPLTAETVHVLGSVPYGPTCIEYVDPMGMHQVYELQEWLAANPSVERYVESLPAGMISLPECSLWPEPSEIDGISDHQREGVSKATLGRIGLLGGSPGTGKTFTLAALIRSIWKSGRVGLHEIGIGAPTGKAAVRLTQALQDNGVPLRARTLHSMLGVGAKGETDSSEWSFQHNESCPWHYKIVFIDESSMPPVNIMAAVMKARAPGCHMMLVGDVNQLPPVGNGAPFRDMIAAGLPYGELREIKRFSGGIVEACAAIRDEQAWVNDYSRASDKNLIITETRGEEEQAEEILKIIHSESERGCNPIWDCQVLVAVNERSALSRKVLNARLQDVLNSAPKEEGTPFRVNDKVVCLKNGFYKLIEQAYDEECDEQMEGEAYVANGELGEVQAIERHRLIVSLDHPKRLIEIPRAKPKSGDSDSETGTGCNWDLGYALSVHKFQGSEQKIIIGVLDSYGGAKMVCDRAWLYTCISRAKDRCYLVGQSSLAERFCRVQKMNERKTFLANRIRLAMFDKEVSEL